MPGRLASMRAANKRHTRGPGMAPESSFSCVFRSLSPKGSLEEIRNFYLTAIEEFEKGVQQWLHQGRLKGQQNAKGEWQIEASNLEVPNVKRLVR